MLLSENKSQSSLQRVKSNAKQLLETFSHVSRAPDKRMRAGICCGNDIIGGLRKAANDQCYSSRPFDPFASEQSHQVRSPGILSGRAGTLASHDERIRGPE